MNVESAAALCDAESDIVKSSFRIFKSLFSIPKEKVRAAFSFLADISMLH